MLRSNSGSKWKVRAGVFLSLVAVLFLTMDAVVKFINPPAVSEASKTLGLAEGEAFTLGVILLVCTVLYSVPPTYVLGAVLLTGYLGGAVATHLRIGAPLFNTMFPVLIGLALWAGLYLREPRLNKLIPLRSNLEKTDE